MIKKHYLTLLTLTFSLFFFSCSTLKTVDGNKKIDTALVGIWGGEETDQQVEGVTKKWKMTRKDDGTFSLEFLVQMGDRKRESIETGNWWVEKDVFYEYHSVSGKTTTYKYKVLDKNSIDFKVLDAHFKFNADSYTFIDKRLTEEKTVKEQGLTVETAIKVNSVTEEYQYLKKHYPNSQFLGQALINSDRDKYYDKLTFKTKEGETKSLYFDITSFFGKGF
ncbi:hypothetical protein [Myroides marinus]|uniref:Lipoprotein n=1 Tax=Myroides marinus TaxID=703342 RepID=A0A165RN20_9FLAO|nr:hypothetical protein [Myroides marinus]KZE83797.1 hypothetical protein AV926_03815 [Myroides marinus]MDM1374951.1 hypothetical protein [Myroides marinus]MDM1379074.1 hypothetical protein [Myroides marinus]MDM1386345.1 hypothetical protein [Myroides marinus]MDM1393585.1 hypothetical protein [Myroides marinus]